MTSEARGKAKQASERASALAKRLARRLGPWVDLVPLTWLGVLVGAGAGAALKIWGLGELDLLLLVTGLAGLALLALCLLVVIAGVARLLLVRPRGGSPLLQMEAGAGCRTGFSLPSLSLLPLVTVRWSWASPSASAEPVAKAGGEERAVARGRALEQAIVRRVEVGDVLGLCRIAFTLSEPREVRVLPWANRATAPRMLRAVSAGDELYSPSGPREGDRIDLRPYSPGDPLRLVLWKVYARTGELVVRTPERAIRPEHRTVAYLVAGPGDEPAAGAARAAVEAGVLGQRWVLGADGVSGRARSAEQAMGVICGSAGAEGGEGLGRFLEETRADGPSRVVLFVPGRPGPWLSRVALALRAQRAEASAIVCVDGAQARPPERLWARLVLKRGEGPRADEIKADAARVAKALADAGCRVELLDRGAPAQARGGDLS